MGMFAKVVTTCIAIIAGLLAFVRYIDQRELELTARNYVAAQKVHEFNIRIYGQATTTGQGKRMLLNEATDLVSTLSTLDNLESPTGRIVIDRFGVFQASFRLNIFNPYFLHDQGSIRQCLLASSFVLI